MITIEQAFNEIERWFHGEDYQILGLAKKTMGTTTGFEQSDLFLSVHGDRYATEYISEGRIWFEYEPGKYILAYYTR